jgi:hypothetical protein
MSEKGHTHVLNCTVNPRYTGLIAYAAPPATAKKAPHLVPPHAAPFAASHAAWFVSASLERLPCCRTIIWLGCSSGARNN